jgi:hypothetical protein
MAPSNQNMGWEGLGTETPFPASILMPSASGLLTKFKKKILHLMLPYPSID